MKGQIFHWWLLELLWSVCLQIHIFHLFSYSNIYWLYQYTFFRAKCFLVTVPFCKHHSLRLSSSTNIGQIHMYIYMFLSLLLLHLLSPNFPLPKTLPQLTSIKLTCSFSLLIWYLLHILPLPHSLLWPVVLYSLLFAIS